jgi:hypothetical protein
MTSFAERDFRVWHYSVSHSSLLIRSPKGGATQTNIDLLFVGVEYVDLTHWLRGPSVLVGDETDLARAATLLSRRIASNETLVTIVAEGRRNLVLARGFEVQENEMEIFESPFDLGPR